jgi:hypothetical protein
MACFVNFTKNTKKKRVLEWATCLDLICFKSATSCLMKNQNVSNSLNIFWVNFLRFPFEYQWNIKIYATF